MTIVGRTIGHLLDNLEPDTRRSAAAWILLTSLAGWPLTALTIARNEPQVVLGLSWLAITITALDVLATTDARAELATDA